MIGEDSWTRKLSKQGNDIIGGETGVFGMSTQSHGESVSSADSALLQGSQLIIFTTPENDWFGRYVGVLSEKHIYIGGEALLSSLNKELLVKGKQKL